MNKFFVWVLFTATLLIDGILLPAVFQISETLLTLVFLTTFLVAYGEKFWVLVSGVIFCVIAELTFGLHLGLLVGSWLVICLLWHGVIQTFSLKPFREEGISSVAVHTIVSLLLLGIWITLYAYLAALLFSSSIWLSQILTIKLVGYYIVATVVYLLLLHGKRISSQY